MHHVERLQKVCGQETKLTCAGRESLFDVAVRLLRMIDDMQSIDDIEEAVRISQLLVNVIGNSVTPMKKNGGKKRG